MDAVLAASSIITDDRGWSNMKDRANAYSSNQGGVLVEDTVCGLSLIHI